MGILKKLQKQFSKTYKKYRKLLRRVGIPVVVLLVTFLIGMQVQALKINKLQPDNLVWSIDETVIIPADLKKMLLELDDCKSYRGTDSPKGVGLWGVMQVEQEMFAKIAYGCSWELTSYILAVKIDKNWLLLKPVDYFADTAQGVPSCKVVADYKIPPTIESFCSNDKGELMRNPTPM